MPLRVEILNLGSLDDIDSSFLVRGRNPGEKRKVPVHAFLILGGPDPILVDTGYSRPESMLEVGLQASRTAEESLEAKLAEHGLAARDIRWVLMTHLHRDHAGRIEAFPASTTVVVNRLELEHGVTGLLGRTYPPEVLKHMIDRVYEPGALRVLDLDLTGPQEIAPGVACEWARGHTAGSMNVLVALDDGVAAICGDVIYDVRNQLIEPFRQTLWGEPAVSGYHTTSDREEKAAVKKLLHGSRYILPSHDAGAVVEDGRVVGRVSGTSLTGL